MNSQPLNYTHKHLFPGKGNKQSYRNIMIHPEMFVCSLCSVFFPLNHKICVEEPRLCGHNHTP